MALAIDRTTLETYWWIALPASPQTRQEWRHRFPKSKAADFVGRRFLQQINYSSPRT